MRGRHGQWIRYALQALLALGSCGRGAWRAPDVGAEWPSGKQP